MPIFGGRWTEQKLRVVRRYLEVYTKALERQPTPDRPFQRLYIDAFAGTGDRTDKRLATQPLLDLPELDAVTKGSARHALEVEPGFHEYILVEKAISRASDLEVLQTEYQNRNIVILNNDANEAITDICRIREWRSTRGVVFLDPYGLQVAWKTLVTICRTRALDVWVLFPTGMGLSRLLTRSGEIPEEWQVTLDDFLGTEEWREHFYRVERETDLFGVPLERTIKEGGTDDLESFIIVRLRSIFPVVMERGVPLTNNRGHAMYLLCFASANPSQRVKDLALRLASWAASV